MNLRGGEFISGRGVRSPGWPVEAEAVEAEAETFQAQSMLAFVPMLAHARPQGGVPYVLP